MVVSFDQFNGFRAGHRLAFLSADRDYLETQLRGMGHFHTADTSQRLSSVVTRCAAIEADTTWLLAR